MARARFQAGSLVIVGKGPKARYYVRYRVYDAEGGYTKRKEPIGLVSKLSKREANKQKAAIVLKGTSQPPKPAAGPKGDMPFGTFYTDVFLAAHRSSWTSRYREAVDYCIGKALPALETVAIGQITKVMIQAILDGMESGFARSTIRDVRMHLRSVFEEAIEQDYIQKNPAKKVSLPLEAAEPKQPVLSEEQLGGYIAKITDVRDSALFHTGTFCLLRTSEAFGMPWRNFHPSDQAGESYFWVDQIAYRGKIYRRTKNKASEDRVMIPEVVLAKLLLLQAASKDTSPDALIFTSTNKNGRAKPGAPLWSGVWFQDAVQVHSEALGVGFPVNFRVTRRSASTHIHDHGATGATVQRVMRHASPNTAPAIYNQPIEESVKRAVNDYVDRVYAAIPKALAKPKLVRVK
jgi:integrase